MISQRSRNRDHVIHASSALTASPPRATTTSSRYVTSCTSPTAVTLSSVAQPATQCGERKSTAAAISSGCLRCGWPLPSTCVCWPAKARHIIASTRPLHRPCECARRCDLDITRHKKWRMLSGDLTSRLQRTRLCRPSTSTSRSPGATCTRNFVAGEGLCWREIGLGRCIPGNIPVVSRYFDSPSLLKTY